MNWKHATFSRLRNAAVSWFLILNMLRFASGVFLLPLLLHLLSTPDLGFYYVLLNIAAMAPLMDLGLLISVERSVAYATAGATELRAHGLHPAEETAGKEPNHLLLWQLLATTRAAYARIALVLLFVLGIAGTLITTYRVAQTSSPTVTWIALALTVFSCVFEIYTSWWNAFLRGMNHMLLSLRILVLAYVVKLALACCFLMAGGGLLSVPAAGFISSLLAQTLSRRACLRRLPVPEKPAVSRDTIVSLIRVLWPNSWRAGLQLLSGYLGSNASGLICLFAFGLSVNAQYGLSVQVALMIQSMSMVWFSVKWPMVSQYRARHDHVGLRNMILPRLRLQIATYALLAVPAFFLGPKLLVWIGSGKALIPEHWFFLLLLTGFLDTQAVFWTTLLSTENQIPSMRAVILTNFASVLLALLLINATNLKVGSLVAAPLVAGAIFNYWYWPKAGARSLHTTWLRFMMRKTA